MKVSHQLFYWHFTRYCLCLLLDTLVSCQFLSKSTVVLITIVALFIQLSTIIYWEYVGLYGKKWGCCDTASSVVHGRTPLYTIYKSLFSFFFSSSSSTNSSCVWAVPTLRRVCVNTVTYEPRVTTTNILLLLPCPQTRPPLHQADSQSHKLKLHLHLPVWPSCLLKPDGAIQTYMIWEMCYMDRVSYTFSGSVSSCFSCILL